MRADELRAAGIPILELPLTSLLNRSLLDSYSLLKSYIRKHGISLFHAFDSPATVFGVPAARLLGVPVVLASQRCYRTLVVQKHVALLGLSDKIAHGVVVNCNAIKRHLIDDCSVPARKIKVCPNGIDVLNFRPPGPSAQSRDDRPQLPGLEANHLVIGTLSLLRPEKDVGPLLHAFANLLPDLHNLRLALIGSGPEKTRLQTLAQNLGIAHACVWEDSTTDVIRWFHSFDIFVLASISEALSNSLMEAMACGCCAVASNVGGNPELIRPGETGLLFEKQDVAGLTAQLRLLVENPEMRKRLAAAGSDLIRRNFSLAIAGRAFHQLYEESLRNAGVLSS
jgi:L-malate glycosyltransferase